LTGSLPRQAGSSSKPDTTRPTDLVEHLAAVVGLEGFERRIRYRRHQVRGAALADDLELLADRLRARQQRAVVSGVGGAQRLAVQSHRVDRDQRQHRQQDADQQRAAQRHRRPLAWRRRVDACAAVRLGPLHCAAFSR
jgi:hypothetical protein